MSLRKTLNLLERLKSFLTPDAPEHRQASALIQRMRQIESKFKDNQPRFTQALIIFVLNLIGMEDGHGGEDEVQNEMGEEEDEEDDADPHLICPVCRAVFVSELLMGAHMIFHTQAAESYVSGVNHLERCVVTAMNGLVRDYKLWCDEIVVNIPAWLMAQYDLIGQCLSPLLRAFVVRAMMYVGVYFVRVDVQTGEIAERMMRYIPSRPTEHVVELSAWLADHVNQIASTLAQWEASEGSDWQVECLNHVMLKVTLSENVAGRGTFQLPAKLKKMHAVVNVNCERACFKYAVLSVLHYADVKHNRWRASAYAAWLNELKFNGVDADNMNIQRDVPLFERMNDIKVNVHVWERGLKGIRYNSRKNTSPRTVNLLLVTNKDGQHHYCGIPKLSRLYRHTKRSNNSPFTCERCTQSFKTQDAFSVHYEWCSRGKAQIEEMPKSKEFGYTNLGHELSPLRVVYADAECYIDPETQRHMPAAFGMYEAWHEDVAIKGKYRAWTGENSVTDFLSELEHMVHDQFQQDNMTRKQMIITPREQHEFNRCEACPKCKRVFTDKIRKVRDHCHITGKYRGPLCHTCNSRLTLKRNVLPVIFHNLKNYDAHLLIKHGLGKFKHWQLHCISQTTEKFMSISAKVPVGKTKTGKAIFFTISFLDSFQFLSSSLATLAESHTSLPVTEKLKDDIPSLSTDVLRRKGVFPYSYFTSLRVLEETSLPSRDAFKNDLSGEECSEEDYSHAHRAWREFGCRTFKDYMMRYLELDVRILTDVFEAFRHLSLRQDKLDPVHFVSLPGLSFQSAFKMTGETVELLQDPFIYNLFERGKRGGMTFVNTHHAAKQLIKVGLQQLIERIMYIDKNNLYGSPLCGYLPHSGFKRLTPHEIRILFPSDQHIIQLDTEADIGYLFEVDLHYPPSIHHLTADFPLAPETQQVTEDMFSEHMKDLYKHIMSQRYPNKTEHKFRPIYKLLLNQTDKYNYVVHFKVLKYYLEKGMTIIKIHNVVQFQQKPFLRPYIEFNTSQRSKATSKHEKDFYKLRNNSLFGKTIEDVRKRSKYHLITDDTKFQKLASSPLFVDRDIITDEIVGVKMYRSRIALNRPIYIGQAVLDLSKLLMYQLYYDILPSCPLIHKIQLLGGDTDSFFLKLTMNHDTTNADILTNLKQYVDFSNYPPTHQLHSDENKARLECFKDEAAGREIEEVILLRPKMYSIKFKDDVKEIKRAKGIGKSVVKNLRHSDYQQAYHNHTESSVNMTILKSIAHSVHTLSFRKRGLSCWDDKRVWLSSNESLPHGHVDSPVRCRKRCRTLPPPSGDVDSDDEQTGKRCRYH